MLKLKERPDGFGFIYGEYQNHNVNIMPPKSLWEGDMVLEGYEPHETDWVLYLDGEEIGRVTKQNQLTEALLKHLSSN